MGVISGIGKGVLKLVHKSLPLATSGGMAGALGAYTSGNPHLALISGGVAVGANTLDQLGKYIQSRPKMSKTDKALAKKAKIQAHIDKLSAPKKSKAQLALEKAQADLAKAEAAASQTPPAQ